MRSLIKLNLGVASTSAVTTAQKHAAVYLFGSKGEAIAKRLDEMARAKELIAPHVAGLLKFLKEAPDDDIIAFKTSASGKKTIAAAKAFASAKTIATSINSLRQIKVAGEWLEAPQGSTAPAETKTHRATKNATGKGAPKVVVENPQAPAAVTKTAADIYPNFEPIVKNKKTGEYVTVVHASADKSYPVGIKRDGNSFVNSSPVYSDVQRFITQGMAASGANLVRIVGKTIDFDKAGATAFEKWLKAQRKAQPLTSDKLFPLVMPKQAAPVPKK